MNNFPDSPATSWSADDSQHLAELHKAVVVIGAILAFSAGTATVLLLPKVV